MRTGLTLIQFVPLGATHVVGGQDDKLDRGVRQSEAATQYLNPLPFCNEIAPVHRGITALLIRVLLQVTMTSNAEHTINIPVSGGSTMEVTLAQVGGEIDRRRIQGRLKPTGEMIPLVPVASATLGKKILSCLDVQI